MMKQHTQWYGSKKVDERKIQLCNGDNGRLIKVRVGS